MTLHRITFQRLPNDGTHRAMCSCGWSVTGDREEVCNRAATHDMDEPKPVVKAKRPAFVSGAYRHGR